MIRLSTKINAPAAELFALSQDYSRRLEWDTFLKEARVIHPDTVPSVGVKTYCKTWNGIGMETEYVTFKAPNVVAVKMTHGPWFLHEFAATWRFEEHEGATIVTFIYHFKCRPLFFTPLIKALLKIEVTRRLKDLKLMAERGH